MSLLLAACASSIPSSVRLDDIPDAKVAAIDALPELGPGVPAGASQLGEVEGISCNRRATREPATWADAVRRTKFRAMQKGANAIADLDCGQPTKGPFLSRLTGYVASTCEETIRCTASAVRK